MDPIQKCRLFPNKSPIFRFKKVRILFLTVKSQDITFLQDCLRNATRTSTSEHNAHDEFCVDQGRNLPFIRSARENAEFFALLSRTLYTKSNPDLVLLGNQFFSICAQLYLDAFLPPRKEVWTTFSQVYQIWHNYNIIFYKL